jgi:hypothetical protein
VHAPRRVVLRWLCQLKVAPYSYDLVDNYGRRSPMKLTPGAEQLAVGQSVMTIFELIDFGEDEHLTMRMRSGTGLRLFGEFTITYTVTEVGPIETRLVVKVLVGDRADTGALSVARRSGLARGDLFMMRRQLRLSDAWPRVSRPRRDGPVLR